MASTANDMKATCYCICHLIDALNMFNLTD